MRDVRVQVPADDSDIRITPAGKQTSKPHPPQKRTQEYTSFVTKTTLRPQPPFNYIQIISSGIL